MQPRVHACYVSQTPRRRASQNRPISVFASRHSSIADCRSDSGEDERIEIVPWPLAELQSAIDECRDAKTLIGLFWLVRRLGV